MLVLVNKNIYVTKKMNSPMRMIKTGTFTYSAQIYN